MIRAMKSHRDGSLLQLLLPCWDFNEECAMILSVCHAVGGFRHCTFAALVVRIALFCHEALLFRLHSQSLFTTATSKQQRDYVRRAGGGGEEKDAAWKVMQIGN